VHLRSDVIGWCTSVKRLGMYIVSCKSFAVSEFFFSALNCIFNKCSSANENVLHMLQESYCLPVLNYALQPIFLVTLFLLSFDEINMNASPAINLKSKQQS
jgi:hypothetical protein